MSWDVFIQDLPGGITNAGEIADDFRPVPLGVHEYVVQRIKEAAPDVGFEDERRPGLGVIRRPDHVIEVDAGHPGKAVESVALFVYGGEGAVRTVTDLVAALGGNALDTGADTGVFSPETALDSYRRWRVLNQS
jgi:hypothetical protein